MQAFELGEKVRAGNVDHVIAFFQHDACNGKGGVGLAEARVAKEHQALAVVVKIFCVAAQIGQQVGHVWTDGTAHLIVGAAGVVA